MELETLARFVYVRLHINFLESSAGTDCLVVKSEKEGVDVEIETVIESLPIICITFIVIRRLF